MRVIAVDDEQLALDNMVALLHEVLADDEIRSFLKSAEAFAYLQENEVDIAFLDIEMGGMNGITLAKKCKDLRPNINVIFITGYDSYTLDALRLHVSGYLLKPVRASDLRVELENLRHPLPRHVDKRVRIQTFGYFEVFADGQPLKFPWAKCKECLAYLIDRRGARVTYADLSAVLWEDKPYDRTVQNNTQKIVSDLVKTFKNIGLQDLIMKSRQDIAIDTALIDCDYYAVLEGDVAQLNAFTGEYMSNYSWAEFTVGELMNIRHT